MIIDENLHERVRVRDDQNPHEKQRNRKTDVPETTVTKRKRGRSRKAASKAERRINRLARQKSLRRAKALRERYDECVWGYKLHPNANDLGIPVTAVVTGPNVHDSQVAIPMEKLTASRVTHLYSLMDCAYDAANTRSWIGACGHKPIMDANKRGGVPPRRWIRLPSDGMRCARR